MQITNNSTKAFIDLPSCGKFTFLLCLIRISDLIKNCEVEGKILIESKNIYGKGSYIVGLRKKVRIVLQKLNSFQMSFYDNIEYGLDIHGVTNKYLNNLSKGCSVGFSLGKKITMVRVSGLFPKWRAVAETLYSQNSGNKARNYSFG